MRSAVIYEEGGNRQVWFAKQIDWYAHFHYRLEIIISIEGSFVVRVNEREYLVHAGEGCIIFPYQIHSIKNIDNSSSCVISTDPNRRAAFGEILSKSEPVSNHLTSPVLPDWLFGLTKNMEEESRSDRGNKDLTRENLLSFADLICGEILSAIETRPIRGGGGIDTLQEILDWCGDHFTEPLTLSDAADALFLSKSCISHVMSSRLHISFTRYINSLWVQRALELLRTGGVQISEVAFESGFGSISTFNRIFHEATGITPTDYRDGNTDIINPKRFGDQKLLASIYGECQ